VVFASAMGGPPKRERLIADRKRLQRMLQECALIRPDGLNDAEFKQMVVAVEARIESLDAEIAASRES